MALSQELSRLNAVAFQLLCNEVAAMLAKIDVILEHNSDLAIDWSAGTTPAYISEDPNGNITDTTFSRTDVSNAVFSLDQIRRVMTNQTVTQGDHLGNINKLARALPIK